MKLSIDRIEGDYAVCVADCGKAFDVEIRCLPANAREGSIIQSSENGYVLCTGEEASKRENNFKRADNLFDE